MKRLFCIYTAEGTLYFANKMEAKAKRKALNPTQDGKEVFTHVVSIGPDHRHYTE